MSKSAVDTLALSLDIYEALDLIEGNVDTILLFNPQPLLLSYRNTILIHTKGYPDRDSAEGIDESTMLDEYLKLQGETRESYPAWAIVAIADISGYVIYDEKSFKDEENRHLVEDPLVVYTAKCGLMGETLYGFRLTNVHVLVPPVYDVFPYVEVQSGEFWLADHPLTLEAFKMALKAVKTEPIEAQ